MTGVVLGRDRARVGVDAEVVGPVVLDEERAVVHAPRRARPRPGPATTALRSGWRSSAARRTPVRRSRASARVELVRVGSVGAAGHRDQPHPGLVRGEDGPPVRRRLHEQRLTRPDQRPEDRGQAALASRDDHDVGGAGCRPVRRGGACQLGREPGLQRVQTRRRGTRVAAGASRRTDQGGADQALGKQPGLGIPRVQRRGVRPARCAGRRRRGAVRCGARRAPRSATRSPRGRAARRTRTNVPTPGRLSTTPAAASVRSAFCTVTGLAPYWRPAARVEGSRAPGRRSGSTCAGRRRSGHCYRHS